MAYEARWEEQNLVGFLCTKVCNPCIASRQMRLIWRISLGAESGSLQLVGILGGQQDIDDCTVYYTSSQCALLSP